MTKKELATIDYLISTIDATISDLYKRRAELESQKPREPKEKQVKKRLPDPRVLRRQFATGED